MHPAWLLDEEDIEMLRLWQAWRGAPTRAVIPSPLGGPIPVETGRTAPVLPFAGGVMDQPACTIAALRIMDEAARRLETRRDD